LAAWRARTFAPRQLILRSGDRVHALTLGTRTQQAVAGAALVALLWTAGAGIGLYWQNTRLDGTARELAQAERSYADLMAEVERARGQMVALANKVNTQTPVRVDPDGDRADASEEAGAPSGLALPQQVARLTEALDALAERNGQLNDRLAAREDALAQVTARNAELVAERVRVERALSETEAALADARLNRSDLHTRVSELREQLRAAQARRQASQQGRLSAEARIAELEERLAVARERAQDAEHRSASLKETLETTRAKRADLVQEREVLAGKVARLEKALGQDGAESSGSLGERIAGLEKALMNAERRGDRLAQVRDVLTSKLADLSQTVHELRARQSDMVAKLSERTLPGLDAIEKTVTMTGLDVDALVKRVRQARSGQGGPFIPASLDLPGPAVAADQLARLDSQMQRLAALQAALGAMPLSAPVDAFWISSHYGKRKDPYNGRWAMHEGIDLAATAGSPVLATAPGTVAFAGEKSGYGRTVDIDHGFGLKTRYAHLRSIMVAKGDRIGHRQTIGALGSSGRSTGPHVHYEVLVAGEPMDPEKFLKAGKHVFKN
jgi:murein DD-endopeptidase MepM/ murein hydrolase activator NlpD